MTPSPHDEWKAAREAFGDMLLRWRSANGWSGQTAEDWHRSCPELLPFKILNSTWTGLELKRNERTTPATFRALGDVNIALSKPDRGVIADRRLRDRIDRAEAIRHSDGTPWTHVDFYRAFWGEIEIPEKYRPEPAITPEEAEQWRNKWRARFREIQQRKGLRGKDAYSSFLREISPAPSASDLEAIDDLVMGFDGLPATSTALRTSLEDALRRWGLNMD